MAQVLVLEDQEDIRIALAQSIEKAADLSLVGAVASTKEAAPLLGRGIDCALVDLMLADGPAFGFIEQLRAETEAKILIISIMGDEESVVRAIQAGAHGYLLKDADDEALAQGIRAVLEGDAPISPAIARHLLRQVKNMPHAPAKGDIPQVVLTRRELQVLEGLAQGLNYKELGRKYDISHYTASDYIKSVYRKLSVNNRAEAVLEGVRKGLIDLGQRAG